MCGEDDIVDGLVPPRPPPAEPFPWHHRAFDVHCHCAERVASIDNLPNMKARAIVVLATRCQDQELVVEMASKYGMTRDSAPETNTLIPGFGRHPWFSHEIYDDVSSSGSALETASEDFKQQHYQNVLTPEPDNPKFWEGLPAPVALSAFISDTRKRLERHPLAIVGEIGLDKAFRLPKEWESEAAKDGDPARTPGGRQGRPLSPHRIKLSHQEAILRAQLKLAGEMNRPVSVHGVQVHGILYNLLVSCWKGHEKSKRRDRKALKASSGETSKAASQENLGVIEESKPFPPRICLHSFSGKAEAVQQYLSPTIPAKIFFSFSKTNNLRDAAGRSKMESAVKAIPKHQLLVETDIHTAGERMDAELEETYRAISEFKEWDLEDCVKTIANNFRNFIMGNESD